MRKNGKVSYLTPIDYVNKYGLYFMTNDIENEDSNLWS